jgi:hypothetical protein
MADFSSGKFEHILFKKLKYSTIDKNIKCEIIEDKSEIVDEEDEDDTDYYY